MVPSKEQLSRIFTSFLKQAPPGEYNIIFDDLRGLHNDEEILNEQANTTLVEFNHKNFELVHHPDINKVRLCFMLFHILMLTVSDYCLEIQHCYTTFACC